MTKVSIRLLERVAETSVASAGMTEDVKAINDGWAHISYEVRGSSTQTTQLDRLAVSGERDIAIHVEGLRNAFGEQVVHEGLDLNVRRGEILGVVGGSGTGKSVLMRSIIDHYAERGYQRIDLGIGSDDYKKLFCKDLDPIFDSYIALSPRGRIVAPAMAALARTKRTVKQSPALKQLAQKLRSALQRKPHAPAAEDAAT